MANQLTFGDSGRRPIFGTMTRVLHEVGALLRKEFLLEWRQKYTISGVLLYVLTTVFVIYSVFIQVSPQVWNTLYWMVMLFASVNAVAKSFIQESNSRQLYYYTLADPLAILFSKIIYNILLLLAIGVLSFLAFMLLAGNPVQDAGLFLVTLMLGSTGFAVTFTFIAAISAKANNSSTLMTILSFPLVIPVVLTLVKLTANALGILADTSISKDIFMLLGIDLLLVGMAILLFPFLWRD
jgi:heme exporter protein B